MAYLHFFVALRDTAIGFAANGGYLALFLCLILEGVPLIGIAVPGHVAIISAGFLISTGVLNPIAVLILGLSGALLGDYLSYSLGKKYGWPLIEKLRGYFFVSEAVIQKVRSFINIHAGKALIIGRFNPVTRGLMSFFVGSNNLHHKIFWIWNIIGSILWVLVSVSIGYALGYGYYLLEGITSGALLISIIAAILIIWSYRFVNIRFHIFKKYELFMLGLNLISLFILFKTVEDSFISEPTLAAFDLFINDIVNNYILLNINAIFVYIASGISAFGGTKFIILLTIISIIILAGHKKWRSLAVLALSVGTTSIFTLWLKELIARIRPENYLVIDAPPAINFLFDKINIITEPSFPSGHAAFSAAFILVLIYLLVPKIKSWIIRELSIVVAVLLVLAIGLSRLILSVHWASDVIAGWALGIFCTTLSVLFVRYIIVLIKPVKILNEGLAKHF